MNYHLKEIRMKQKLETIIKKNSFINKLYTWFGSLLVKVLGLFIKEQPKTILFVSFMGKNFNDSPKVIYDKLINDPDFQDYTFIWAFTQPDNYKIDNKNTQKVKIDSFDYLKTALAASYWVTNVNIERGLHFKKNYTKSINTWHGVPLKKIGNDVEGRNDFNFSDTNVFCYSGAYEYEIYKRAFKLTDENLYEIGMPRNEILLKDDEKLTDTIKKELNISNKKIILYAPTWRENHEDLKLMNIDLWEQTLSDEYVLLVKSHGLSQRFGIGKNSFVKDVSDYEETADLLLAADILITDYSSIMFDFALLAKPIFIYMPDYDKYISERGVYFDLRTSNLSIFETAEPLLDYIQDYDRQVEEKKSREFGKQFIEVREPNASQTIINLMKEELL